jgi:hypothetical protein
VDVPGNISGILNNDLFGRCNISKDIQAFGAAAHLQLTEYLRLFFMKLERGPLGQHKLK